MTTSVNEILSRLNSLTNEKMVAHNLKTGVEKDKQFGVKMGDLRAISKEYKPDNGFALELWNTGILEARLLGILWMKPKEFTPEQLVKLVEGIEFVQVADWFASYVLKEFPVKYSFTWDWINSQNCWLARLGWGLLAGKIATNSEGIDYPALLSRIETEMPVALPEVKWTMNTALAYIGIYQSSFREQAIQIGEKLGVYRDYPVSKGCTSPFAPIWINEMVRRQKA